MHKTKSKVINEKFPITDAFVLTIPERIQLVEDTWDIIAAESVADDLIDEDKKSIDERLETYH